MNIIEYAIARKLAGGGSAPAVIEPLSVTANGLYIPPEGVDGYDKVTVNVTPSTDGEVRSLKKLLDATKSAYAWFYGYQGASLDELIEYSDTSNVTNMKSMFYSCNNLTTIPQLDTSNVTNTISMFEVCSNLTTIPQLDTSNVTDMSNMFRNCISLTTIPQLDTGKVTSMGKMFEMCLELVTIPKLDTSKVTNMGNMFYGCKKLTAIPQLNTCGVTSMTETFRSCNNLTTIPQLDTSKVKYAATMFADCIRLATIPQLDVRALTSASNMFVSCKALTEIWIRNIQTNLTVGSGTSYGHLLTVESLVHLCNELRNVNAARTLTVGSANLTKLTDIYVKLVEITDEMRAEDDLIDEKLPCVVCDSTDPDAMLITDYVTLKRWTLV